MQDSVASNRLFPENSEARNSWIIRFPIGFVTWGFSPKSRYDPLADGNEAFYHHVCGWGISSINNIVSDPPIGEIVRIWYACTFCGTKVLQRDPWSTLYLQGGVALFPSGIQRFPILPKSAVCLSTIFGQGIPDGVPIVSKNLFVVQDYLILMLFNEISGVDDLLRLFTAVVHFPPLHSRKNNDSDSQEHNRYVRPSSPGSIRVSPPHLRSFKQWALTICGYLCVTVGIFACYFGWGIAEDWFSCGLSLIALGLFLTVIGVWLTGHFFPLGRISVSQKQLTSCSFPYYTKCVANVLGTDEQIGIIGSLCEGSSIRSIERTTGVHRDTIMRLGVKVGKGCTALMDAKMRNLDCHRLEMDEIWGYVGKKEKHVRPGDDPQFVLDVAGRMKNRVQISTDGLVAYVEAIDWAFGRNVDYGQIIKVYGTEESVEAQRRYSAPKITSSEKKAIFGRPDFDLISTSYVGRLNATTRLHMKRLARLMHAFSKKRENFEAAVGLHFAYYNFVRRHNTLRCTPAMAAGVEQSFWSVGELLEAAA